MTGHALASLPIIVAACGAAVGACGLALAASARSRADRLARQCAFLLRGGGEGGGADPRAVREVAIVRYDALTEMSGQLSFSVALLNARGDGIVLSSINGRSETRTYAKAVTGGQGEQELSPEEARAVQEARLGGGQTAAAAGDHRAAVGAGGRRRTDASLAS